MVLARRFRLRHAQSGGARVKVGLLPGESTEPGKLKLKDRMNITHQPKLTLNKTTVRYPTLMI